jgi:hypothetical protein
LYFLWHTADATKITAQAALDQWKVARAAHRPWIEPNISIAKPLTFFDNFAVVDLIIKARNGGTAPAILSEPILSLILIDASTKVDPSGTKPTDNPVLKEQATWCNPQAVDAQFKARKPTGSGRLLLPNSEVTYPTWGLQTKKPNDDVLAAWITGCIAYVDEFDSPHVTLVTLLFATSYPFKSRPGLVVNTGVWGLAPYGQGAY